MPQQDFIDALKDRITTLDEEDLRIMFMTLDVDRSGTLDLNEIRNEFADVTIANVFRSFNGDLK